VVVWSALTGTAGAAQTVKLNVGLKPERLGAGTTIEFGFQVEVHRGQAPSPLSASALASPYRGVALWWSAPLLAGVAAFFVVFDGLHAGEQEAEDRCGHACPKQQLVCVISIDELCAANVFLGFRGESGRVGLLQRKREQRRCRNEFHQRRMFWIQPEISSSPILVSGIQVGPFIESLGELCH